jgi:O-antigen/teichoic acid export membrane protein
VTPEAPVATPSVAPGAIGLATRARLISVDGTVTMLAGTILAGIGAYVWQGSGTRTLGEDAFSPVAQAWTVMFLVVTILLAPVEQFATRTVAAGSSGRQHLGAALPRIRLLAALATALLAVATFLLRDALFDGSAVYALVCAVMVPCFGLVLLSRGILSGERRFASYGWLTGLDSAARLTIGLPVLLLTKSPVAFAATIPAATLVGLFWLRFWPPAARARSDAGPSVGTFLATTVGGNSAAQFIVAGGPLILALAGSSGADVTALFVTQTAFRGLFLIATPGWSRVLPVLTRIHVREEHSLLRQIAELILVATVLASAAAALVAGLVGPWAIATFFGEGSRPSTLVAATVGAGTVLAVGSLGLNQVLIARVKTARITAAWWMGLVAMVLWILIVPGAVVDRVAASFVVGEAVALIMLTIAASSRLAPAPVRRTLVNIRERRRG